MLKENKIIAFENLYPRIAPECLSAFSTFLESIALKTKTNCCGDIILILSIGKSSFRNNAFSDEPFVGFHFQIPYHNVYIRIFLTVQCHLF